MLRFHCIKFIVKHRDLEERFRNGRIRTPVFPPLALAAYGSPNQSMYQTKATGPLHLLEKGQTLLVRKRIFCLKRICNGCRCLCRTCCWRRYQSNRPSPKVEIFGSTSMPIPAAIYPERLNRHWKSSEFRPGRLLWLSI